jgi:ABC-2 type transport system ATP-binding protein
MAPPTARVSITSLTRRYRSGRGIMDVSFDIAAGTVCALLGPNGAGKTTTLRCLTGLLAPDSGHISIAGHPAGSDAAKRAVAYVPDQSALFPVLNVEEHVRFRAQAFGVRHELDDRIAAALEQAGIAELADEPAGELSRGQRQRVMIAAALVQEAYVYVFDEPTVGLDPPGRAWIEDWLRRAAERGDAVLIASHERDVVSRVADKAVLLLDGRVAADLPVPDDEHAQRQWRHDVLRRYGGMDGDP